MFKMADFHHILDVFSGLNDQIDLNHFTSCQASSVTSLEYPHNPHGDVDSVARLESFRALKLSKPYWRFLGP